MARTFSPTAILLGLCLSRPAPAGEPTSVPRATTPQVQQTVDHAIKYLQTEGAKLKSGDFAIGQTLYALSLAGLTTERPEIRRGIRAPYECIAHTSEASAGRPARSASEGNAAGPSLARRAGLQTVRHASARRSSLRACPHSDRRRNARITDPMP
jgi:hypothetical protein